MAFSVGRVVGELELQDKWTATLQNAVNQTQRAAVPIDNLKKSATQLSPALQAAAAEHDRFNKIAEKFEGTRVLERANQYVEVVHRMGGVLNLTAKEQQEVNKVLGEAMNKYAALGKQAPLDLERMEERTRSLQKATISWSDAASKAQSAGVGLTAGLTVPIVGIGTAAITMASQFEASMLKVHTISGVAEADIAGLSAEVMKLATETATAPNDLAKALQTVTSTGLSAAQGQEVLRQAAMASAAGLGDVNDIARSITAAMKAYGMENLSAADAANKLFVAVRAGGAEISGFAGTLGRVIGIAATVGISFDEVVSSIATFTRLGVNASEAVTALRGTMNVMYKATNQNREGFAELGLSVEVFRKAVKEKGLTAALIEIVELANKMGNEDALGKIFGNVRGLAGILANAGSQAKEYANVTKQVVSGQNDLREAFEKTTKTTEFQMRQLKVELSNVALALGKDLLPTVKEMIPYLRDTVLWIGEWVKWWGQLPGPIKDTTLLIAGFAAVLGPLLITAGSVIRTIASLGLLFGAGGGAAGGAGIAAGAAGAGIAISTVLVPALLAIMVPFALYELVQVFKQLRGLWNDSSGWKKDAEGVAYTMNNTMAVAARMAGKEFKTHADAVKFLNDRIKETNLNKFSLDLTATGMAGLKLNGAVTAASTSTEVFGRATGKTAEELEAAAKAAEEYQRKLAGIAGKLSGLDLIKAAEDTAAALKMVGPLQKLSIESQREISKTMNDAIEVYKRGGREIPAAIQAIANEVDYYISKQVQLDALMDKLHQKQVAQLKVEAEKWKEWEKVVENSLKMFTRIPGTRNLSSVVPQIDVAAVDATRNIPNLPRDFGDMKIVLDALDQSLQQLARTVSGKMGGIIGGFSDLANILKQAKQIEEQFGGKNFGIASAMFDSTASSAEKWAAGIQSATAIVSGAMSVWAAASASGSKAATTFNAAMAGAQAGAAFGPWGAAIGAAGGALTGFIRSLTAGRRAVEDFGKSFGGLDALHDRMNALIGDTAEVERLWIQLTQKTKKGDTAGAERIIAEIQAAMANSPAAMAEAAGYKTRAELEKTADSAKKLYDYMVASGQYSAESIEDAFSRMTEANEAAMSDSAKAQKKALDEIESRYKDQFSALTEEYDRLYKSVAAEAEEAEMGVIEMQERERMKQIEKERSVLQAKMDEEIAANKDAHTEMGTDIQTSAEKVWRELEGYYGKNPLRLPYYLDPLNGPGSGPNGGPGPTGTSGFTSDQSGRPGGVTVNVLQDGEVTARAVMPHIASEYNVVVG